MKNILCISWWTAERHKADITITFFMYSVAFLCSTCFFKGKGTHFSWIKEYLDKNIELREKKLLFDADLWCFVACCKFNMRIKPQRKHLILCGLATLWYLFNLQQRAVYALIDVFFYFLRLSSKVQGVGYFDIGILRSHLVFISLVIVVDRQV